MFKCLMKYPGLLEDLDLKRSISRKETKKKGEASARLELRAHRSFSFLFVDVLQ